MSYIKYLLAKIDLRNVKEIALLSSVSWHWGKGRLVDTPLFASCPYAPCTAYPNIFSGDGPIYDQLSKFNLLRAFVKYLIGDCRVAQPFE
jgi:hypothetical protein